MTRGALVGIALLVASPSLGIAQPARPDNPHGSLQTTTDCDACHTSSAWKPAKARPDFNHNTSSSFLLVGQHEEAECKSCHLDLRFDAPKIAASDCASCHVDVHLGQLSNECATCHTTLAFADVSALAIHSRTSFPLSGSHLQISCESCHTDDRGGAYSTLVNDCVACHQADYVGAESIDHVAQNFPTACERCHNTLAWSGSGVFDHLAASSGFALTGAHASLGCAQCHDPSSNALLFPPPSNQNDCVACHQEDYDRQHGGGGTPTSCTNCHNDQSWEDADFNHVTASNGFALLGAHSTLDCTVCHDPSSNALLFPPPSGQNDCVACHQDDYNGQHSGSGIPTSCSDCHTQATWAGASFDHVTASNGFALLGAHSTLDCTVCHDPSSNALLFPPPSGQNDCVACHQDDYDRQHSGSGFPTTCSDCHTQTTWLGATFQHDQFPIYSGIHSGKWNGCDTCHDVPSNYTSFTCFNCHQHSQSRMDSRHAGVGGYTYDSSACYSCHPNGRR